MVKRQTGFFLCRLTAMLNVLPLNKRKGCHILKNDREDP